MLKEGRGNGSVRCRDRTTALVLATVLLMAGASSSRAVLCTIDEVPAATLLIPHFRVDLDRCAEQDGLTTIVSVTNLLASPAIGHLTLWTDESVPTAIGDFFLTGYDQVEFDVRSFFCDEFSDAAAVTARSVAPLGNSTVAQVLRATHTGEAHPDSGLCYGRDHGEKIARGYMTIDSVVDFTDLTHAHADYYADELLAFENRFLGSYTFSENGKGSSFLAVHVEPTPRARSSNSATRRSTAASWSTVSRRRETICLRRVRPRDPPRLRRSIVESL